MISENYSQNSFKMLEAALEVVKSPGLEMGLGKALGHWWKGTGTMELMRLNSQGSVLAWLLLKILGGAPTMY